ncbi:MAG: DEAD/DEAH box helicase [Capsulimonadaceae bacterium]
MNYNPKRALDLLRAGTDKPKAQFRNGQEDALRHIIEGRGRLLVVQRSGWGKSFAAFLATKLLREGGGGPVLLVSPLLSLMRGHLFAAERMGVRVSAVHSNSEDEWVKIDTAIRRSTVDIVLISPERLGDQRFITHVLPGIADRIGMFVMDEAHCLSDWGHDFRPDYRRIEKIVRRLPTSVRLVATTSAATNRVLDDLRSLLGAGLTVLRGDLDRPTITLQTIRMRGPAERLAWLAATLPVLEGNGIIYTATQREANQAAAWLKSCGLNVAAYDNNATNAPDLEESLRQNRLTALIATPAAFGIVYDKPDVAFVIHCHIPASAAAYYQQIGRAGRSLTAYGIILACDCERPADMPEEPADRAFPASGDVRTVLEAIHGSNGLSDADLVASVNLPNALIQKTFGLLALESPPPVVKQGPRWQLTALPSKAFWERVDRLTDLRKQEQARMREYMSLEFGHMDFLIRELDGNPASATVPTAMPLPATVKPVLVEKVVTFLNRMQLPIEPRQLWPNGGLPRYNVAGEIPLELYAERGKALCTWGDAGWGSLVRQGKEVDACFDDELVEACAGLVREWKPAIHPAWVTAIPSLRHPTLVPDFAARLAARLELPFHSVLTRTEDRPEQSTMANSIHRALNVDGSLAVADGDLPAGPVLLVDDLVESRWTLTIAAWLLRSHASGPVYPLVLAMAPGAQ